VLGHAKVGLQRSSAIRRPDPYEAMLRQHVRKSLVEKSVPSMKLVLTEAEKHELIFQPPQRTNNTFVVPKNVPEDIQRQIFDNTESEPPEGPSMARIIGLLLTVIDVERLKRCFNGR
jgi:hypothetical protein